MEFGAHKHLFWPLVLLLAMSIVGGAFSPAAAQDEDDDSHDRHTRNYTTASDYDRVRWTLRGFLVGAGTDDDGVRHYRPWWDENEWVTVDEDYEGGGFGISGEARLSRRVGIEITGLVTTDPDDYDWHFHWDDDHDHDHEWDGDFHDSGMAALLASANFYVLTGRHVELHVGPVAGFMGREMEDDHDHYIYIEGDKNHDHDHDWDDDWDDWEGALVAGVNVGLDVRFGRSGDWSFYVSYKNVHTVAESDYFEDGKWDIASMGFGYRF